ncbi:MAG: hypothetical protein HC794_08875 [Nitrospiraceae bacterium]|nr:hypothetical protein [Nitrospiraceae bacterium]
MPAKVYTDKDANLAVLKNKTLAVLGFGSQGHAHAQNLNDSGCKVTVGLRKGGASWSKVEKAGLKVQFKKITEHNLPDELQAALERGKSLDLDTVVQELLAEFGGDERDVSPHNPSDA